MYHYQRTYRGPIRALIMDMAGTCVDFGSTAPIHAFRRLFADQGVPISVEEARTPMGSEKREHIRALLAMPRIAEAWRVAHGSTAGDGDVDRLYGDFVPVQISAIAERARAIPGLRELLEHCRSADIRVGVNTGYGREMIGGLLAALAEQGFLPESVVCATDVLAGRPAPQMALKGAIELDAPCVQACVKVDDTAVGIEEGLNAGMWSIGVAVTGNAVGLDLETWRSLPEAEQGRLRERAHQALLAAGAHAVVDSIADLPELLTSLNARLARGERP
ncbi:phosphonoacetaldehyde hydrolase [Telmatospirillum sp. J64-1]|uniref:phosphonoacetaldehyde hydrolase n=1 Tax=Telmatospirillum sp. J64-1 TaxID=2502183 RepID=UPI00115C7A5F|nr:phosphonoacetaldehyde hydrolase [Telmatospirillum sp. J64-1]